jgi:succinyl-CoA synthetase alpha subunit
MSILVDSNTRLVVQGITGREGSFQTRRCIEYGTKVVAGVTPGRGGETAEGVPVFNTVREAVDEAGANCSLIFVPAAAAADAILEAADAGVDVIICITEGIPTQDMLTVRHYLQPQGVRLVGPNCPGVISPGQARVGIMPGDVFSPGHVGVISRSGTLVYEAVAQLTELSIGQSTCVGVGGDPIIGTTPLEAIRLFDADPDTTALVFVGEIGGVAEQEAADYIANHMSKPVIAFVAGSTAPRGAAWATPAPSSPARPASRRPRKRRWPPAAPPSSTARPISARHPAGPARRGLLRPRPQPGLDP